ncbi:MAG: SpoIIE family protein phosphatase, partial [Oscillospiraceae bacterium]|nr:SpoIIE family protein phosphatase [Oscillospiraceae bacterium]
MTSGELTAYRLDRITAVMEQLVTETRLPAVLDLLTVLTRELVKCDRVSFWFWDKPAGKLWTLAASSSGRLTLPDTYGLVAETVRSGEVQRIDDVYADRRFNPAVDRQTGYRTRSLLTVPLLNSRSEVIGAYQCINRLTEEGKPALFTEEDVRLLSVVSAFAGKSLESYGLLAEREAMEAELDVAGEIQRDILPELAPLERGRPFTLDALVRPARTMGGDFFDAYLLPDGRLALTVADVSDKGISAALFMMNAKAVLKERALNLGGSPGEILTYAGNRLREENAMGLFVTVWMGCLDQETGTLEYASAGHEDPILLRKGRTRLLEPGERKLPLGLMTDIRYSTSRVSLCPGDTLLQYTDGAPDAASPLDEAFGLDRLRQTFRKLAARRVEDL